MSSALVKKKLIESDLFDCKNIHKFIESIRETLNYKGVSNSRFYMCELDGTQFLTKLCFYKKTQPEIYNHSTKGMLSHVDAEVNILSIFKEKILNTHVSPCILELVHAKICANLNDMCPREEECNYMLYASDDSPEIDVKQSFCRYREAIKENIAHDKCAFLVLERCDMTLERYLKRHTNTPVCVAIFKMILFQIVYTFYAINKLYPKFRHLDLHTENVMLKFDQDFKFKANDIKYMEFQAEGHRYFIPYMGIVVKLIDFGYSSLPEKNIINSQTSDKLFMFHRSENDLVLLFHHIYHTIADTGADKTGKIHAVLRQLEPSGSYVHYFAEYIRKSPELLANYQDMLMNSLFDEYKISNVLESQIYSKYSVSR